MSPARWKALCGVLAAVTAYSWLRGGASRVPTAAAERAPRIGYRPLRVSPSALGVTTDDIVQRLLNATGLTEMRMLAEQLGAVGDDAAIDAVVVLVRDPRPSVPELVVNAIGAIGTEHAVDVLTGLAREAHTELGGFAIRALATTGNSRAETFLVDLAKRKDTTAIEALAQLGTERAAEVLYRIAAVGTDGAADAAIAALGRMDTPASSRVLVRLLDAPSVQTVAKALEVIEHVDGDLLAKLADIVNTGEAALVQPAVLAIAHAGDDALPILRDLALGGVRPELRVVAVQALARLDSPEVVELLGTLIDHGDDDVAKAAAQSLARIDAPEARDLLINAALSDRAEVTQAVDALVTLDAPEIEPALLEIAKADQYGAPRALARLLARDNHEALELVLGRAGSPDPDTRYGAFELLADAATETSTSKLLALVRAEHGELKPRALGLVTSARPGDPEVTSLLHDSLHARDPEEKRAAAAALGRVGTDAARDELVAAIASGDSEVTQVALEAIGAYRLTDEAANAIHSAAMADPDLMSMALDRLLAAGVSAGFRLAESAINGDSRLAMQALGRLRDINSSEAFELIARGVRASSDDVRAMAVRVLGSSKDPRAADTVAQALHDSSSQVRMYAINTLGELGGERARTELMAMTHSSDPSERMVAVRCLPDGPSTLSRRRELVFDPDQSVAYYAMRSLLDSNEGVQVMRRLVFDGRAATDTRMSAAQLLEGYDQLDAATAAWLEQMRASSSGEYW